MIAVVQLELFNNGAIRRCKILPTVLARGTKENRPRDSASRVAESGRMDHGVNYVIHKHTSSNVVLFYRHSRVMELYIVKSLPLNCQF